MPSHEINRENIADEMAAKLEHDYAAIHGSTAGLAEWAESFNGPAWNLVAVSIGRDSDYTPAPATQRETIRVLRQREIGAKRERAASVRDPRDVRKADPFAGIDEASYHEPAIRRSA